MSELEGDIDRITVSSGILSHPDAGQFAGDQGSGKQQRCDDVMIYEASRSNPGSLPVLSANLSTGVPNASNIETYRFASGLFAVNQILPGIDAAAALATQHERQIVRAVTIPITSAELKGPSSCRAVRIAFFHRLQFPERSDTARRAIC